MSEAQAAALAVHHTVHIEAPRERVFELLTDPAQIPSWMPVTALEPRVGGRFEFIRDEWQAEGEVVAFDPPRLVAYTWDWRNQPMGVRTEVRWELEEEDGGTTVHLSHTGFPEGPHRENHDHGWRHYGERLKTVAEGGDPGPDVMEPTDVSESVPR
ncbi:MAG: SRPBCC domain-containing protein [Solirubrobacterales bacterium]|nr:SRPBCC domain-containing protein [Solirubrobacterales bacterium]